MIKKIKRIPKKYLALILIVLIGGGYGAYKVFAQEETTATVVYGKVRTGDIAVEITGTGQISASSEMAISAKVSGDVTATPVAVGQEVKAGTLLVKIDSRDAYVDLENARIAYQKLTKPADAVSVSQAEGALVSAQQSKASAEADIVGAYDTGFSEVTSVYIDVPTVLSELNDIYSSSGYLSEGSVRAISSTAHDLRTRALDSYYTARSALTRNQKIYTTLSRQSASSSIEKLIQDTYILSQQAAQAVKDAKNVADFVHARRANDSTQYAMVQTDIDGWNSTMTGHITSLSGSLSKIETAKSTLANSDRTIQEKRDSLMDLTDGADPLDLRSQVLALQQKEIAYQNTMITAPFDGVLAKLDVKAGDEINSGDAIATFITKQKIATISLNEVDVAKIKTGQKVVLTIDAIEGIDVQGTVAEVDLVGSVSQGVVSYNVKINLDTQDERIRSGMSISATIKTDAKDGVLLVPNSAIRNGGVMTRTGMKKVEVGISNETSTEIVSGLVEGDEIVVRTTGTTGAATTRTPTLFGAGGATRIR